MIILPVIIFVVPVSVVGQVWGDHRHPIQFSGDAVANWELLRFEIDLTTTSGNAGLLFLGA
mgnify:CR=1 FL=1